MRRAPSRLAVVLTCGLFLVCWQTLLLFPGDTLRDRFLYRVAVIRTPGNTIIPRRSTDKDDSYFSEEQKSLYGAVFRWASTPTVRCRRQAAFGGQVYSDDEVQTLLLEGDRPVCFDPDLSMANPSQPCVVYSFGVKNDWSFDDAMARFGCEVHSFDPTVTYPRAQRPSGVHFHRSGLGRNNHVNAYGWKIQTLDTVMRELGHAQLDRLQYLKIDAEGAEFDMLAQQLLDREGDKVLDKFDQIGMEVHFRLRPETEDQFYHTVFNITKTLQQRGWHVADAAPNKIYNKWFHYPGLDEPVSHMFDVLLLRRRPQG